ncbi:MAG: hypothetical protein FD153_793, partial [Rhodospirillaceae bacterium]
WREWVSFLQSTFVCDRADSHHPCQRATPIPIPETTFLPVRTDNKNKKSVERKEKNEKKGKTVKNKKKNEKKYKKHGKGNKNVKNHKKDKKKK